MIRFLVFFRPFVLRLSFATFLCAMVCILPSCGIFVSKRSAASVQAKMERNERKRNKDLVKQYDKLYKQQTKMQAKAQKKRIKKSRKRPSMMRRRRY